MYRVATFHQSIHHPGVMAVKNMALLVFRIVLILSIVTCQPSESSHPRLETFRMSVSKRANNNSSFSASDTLSLDGSLNGTDSMITFQPTPTSMPTPTPTPTQSETTSTVSEPTTLTPIKPVVDVHSENDRGSNPSSYDTSVPLLIATGALPDPTNTSTAIPMPFVPFPSPTSDLPEPAQPINASSSKDDNGSNATLPTFAPPTDQSEQPKTSSSVSNNETTLPTPRTTELQDPLSNETRGDNIVVMPPASDRLTSPTTNDRTTKMTLPPPSPSTSSSTSDLPDFPVVTIDPLPSSVSELPKRSNHTDLSANGSQPELSPSNDSNFSIPDSTQASDLPESPPSFNTSDSNSGNEGSRMDDSDLDCWESRIPNTIDNQIAVLTTSNTSSFSSRSWCIGFLYHAKYLVADVNCVNSLGQPVQWAFFRQPKPFESGGFMAQPGLSVQGHQSIPETQSHDHAGYEVMKQLPHVQDPPQELPRLSHSKQNQTCNNTTTVEQWMQVERQFIHFADPKDPSSARFAVIQLRVPRRNSPIATFVQEINASLPIEQSLVSSSVQIYHVTVDAKSGPTIVHQTPMLQLDYVNCLRDPTTFEEPETSTTTPQTPWRYLCYVAEDPEDRELVDLTGSFAVQGNSIVGIVEDRMPTFWHSVLPIQGSLSFIQRFSHVRAYHAKATIMGGNPVQPRGFLAGLRETAASENFCGGSLIAPKFVLTAAHCVDGVNFERVSVGSHYASSDKDGEQIKVKRVMVHPRFDRAKYRFDYALVELSFISIQRPIVLQGVKRPVFAANDRLTLYGFGGQTDTTQAVDLPVVPNDKCEQALQKKLDDTLLCAGGEKGKDGCQGESGGPLVNNEHLTALMSFGRGCGIEGIPGAYALVSEAADFINANSRNHRWSDGTGGAIDTRGSESGNLVKQGPLHPHRPTMPDRDTPNHPNRIPAPNPITPQKPTHVLPSGTSALPGSDGSPNSDPGRGKPTHPSGSSSTGPNGSNGNRAAGGAGGSGGGSGGGDGGDAGTAMKDPTSGLSSPKSPGAPSDPINGDGSRSLNLPMNKPRSSKASEGIHTANSNSEVELAEEQARSGISQTREDHSVLLDQVALLADLTPTSHVELSSRYKLKVSASTPERVKRAVLIALLQKPDSNNENNSNSMDPFNDPRVSQFLTVQGGFVLYSNSSLESVEQLITKYTQRIEVRQQATTRFKRSVIPGSNQPVRLDRC